MMLIKPFSRNLTIIFSKLFTVKPEIFRDILQGIISITDL